MIRRALPRRLQAFTLIEVVVALAILGWVLGSAIFLVSRYADDRTRMRELGLGGQVAWNQLMERYRRAQGWYPPQQVENLELQGSDSQGGVDWRWTLDIEPAAGFGLFRYQVNVEGEAGEQGEDNEDNEAIRPASTLTVYLEGQGGGT